MHAGKHFFFGLALSALATTAHAIDDRGATVNHAERAAAQVAIDSSIKNELKRILRESLPAYVAVRSVDVMPSDDCARATGDVDIVLATRLPERSCTQLRDSFF